MKKMLLGRKVGMTQLIKENGQVVPVTVVQAGPCTVLKVMESAPGKSILIGYEPLAEKKCNKPQEGFFKSLGIDPKANLIQFKTDQELEPKAELKVDIFEEEERVNVRGRSIGKGFAGTIRRHNFKRGPKSHGSKSHRIPGSIGAGTTPGRVFKGKRMAGHLGNQNTTIRNLVVVRVDSNSNLLFIKGAVPGKANTLLEIYN